MGEAFAAGILTIAPATRKKQGIDDRTTINQIANYALLEWPDNIDISDSPPNVYVPLIRKRFSHDDWAITSDLHGLPANWESFSYQEFLPRRREQMASIIRRGFETLM